MRTLYLAIVVALLILLGNWLLVSIGVEVNFWWQGALGGLSAYLANLLISKVLLQ